MKFTIEEPLHEYRSVYVIRADFATRTGYESVDWPYPTAEAAEPVVTFLDALLATNDSKCLDLSKRCDLPCDWVVDSMKAVPLAHAGFDRLEWPEDGDIRAELETYTVYWYDARGHEHDVLVTR